MSDGDLWELLNRLREWQLTGPVVVTGVPHESEDGQSTELTLTEDDISEMESGIRRWLGSPRRMDGSYLAGWEAAEVYHRGSERSGVQVSVTEVVEWIVEEFHEKMTRDRWRGDLLLLREGVSDWFLSYTGRTR